MARSSARSARTRRKCRSRSGDSRRQRRQKRVAHEHHRVAAAFDDDQRFPGRADLGLEGSDTRRRRVAIAIALDEIHRHGVIEAERARVERRHLVLQLLVHPRRLRALVASRARQLGERRLLGRRQREPFARLGHVPAEDDLSRADVGGESIGPRLDHLQPDDRSSRRGEQDQRVQSQVIAHRVRDRDAVSGETIERDRTHRRLVPVDDAERRLPGPKERGDARQRDTGAVDEEQRRTRRIGAVNRYPLLEAVDLDQHRCVSRRYTDVRAWVDVATRVVALTGAGISTESGIPDFRGPQGVWTKNPKAEQLSSIDAYVSDPEVRRWSWRSRLEHPAWSAQPNAGHRALVDLEQRGKLHALVTQNIDGLHQLAGSSPAKVIEVHGTMRDVVCLSCAWRAPMPDVLARVRAGEADPACERCGGILKSATISFGQPLVPHVIDRALRAASVADVLLAIGTSLQVYPIAGAVPIAKSSGARVVIVNAEPTPFDEIADAVIREPIGEALPALVS